MSVIRWSYTLDECWPNPKISTADVGGKWDWAAEFQSYWYGRSRGRMVCLADSCMAGLSKADIDTHTVL